jgi:hypothetical protein
MNVVDFVLYFSTYYYSNLMTRLGVDGNLWLSMCLLQDEIRWLIAKAGGTLAN